MNQDLRAPAITGSLKDRLEFKCFMLKQPRLGGGATCMSTEQFKKIIDQHNSRGHSHFTCMSFAQTAMGLRFDNVKMLFSANNYTMEPHRCGCSKSTGSNTLCNPITNNCFRKLTFKKSKTGSLECTLIPAVLPCLKFLNNAKTHKLASNANYNSRLKEMGLSTSHSLRKYIYNISANVRATAWRGSYTFDRYYKDRNTPFVDMHFLLLELGFRIKEFSETGCVMMISICIICSSFLDSRDQITEWFLSKLYIYL